MQRRRRSGSGMRARPSSTGNIAGCSVTLREGISIACEVAGMSPCRSSRVIDGGTVGGNVSAITGERRRTGASHAGSSGLRLKCSAQRRYVFNSDELLGVSLPAYRQTSPTCIVRPGPILSPLLWLQTNRPELTISADRPLPSQRLRRTGRL